VERIGIPAKPLELEMTTLRPLEWGYVWLFVATGYLFARCTLDVFIARRPKVDPNLDISGMACLGCALFGFLMFEVVTKEPDPAGRASATVAQAVLAGQPRHPQAGAAPIHPTTTFFHAVVAVPYGSVWQRVQEQPLPTSELIVGVARSAAILAHLLILAALVLIGWQHFDSPQSGVGMATLYLLTPLTAISVEKVDHLLPAVFTLWAIYFFRWPKVAGALLGLASAFVFPLFLLPLWLGFYGRKGAKSCLIGFLSASAAIWALVFAIDSVRDFVQIWASAVGWKANIAGAGQTLGFWTETTQFFRLPIFVAFSALVMLAAFWPAEKNLGDLIALSAAIILGVQFWYPDRGGTYVLWYLPLLLLVFFRPTLQGVRPDSAPAPV
jgi:hypothetical protein